MADPRRRAVVGGPVRRIGARVQRGAGRRAGDVARPPRAGQGAGLALEARGGAGRGAGGAAHRAARRRAASHRRHHPRAAAPLRPGRGRLHQLRQPAAQQGPQRQGAVVEGADPVPAGVQGPPGQRPRRQLRRPAAHRGLQAGAGQGHRQGPRSTAGAGSTSSSTPAPSRRRSRGRSPSRAASRRSPTRSAPASAKSGCAACSWPGSTPSRSARSRSTTCRC